MKTVRTFRWGLGPLLALLVLAAFASAANAALPDPMQRGTYTPVTVDPVKVGLVDLQEPSASGGAATGTAAAATVQLRGSLYYPGDRGSGSPVIILVHGNHASCASGSAPNCTVYERNDRGYAYLGENLATWGYTVFSIDQDQLMYYQDGTARGMHQRRLIIAATLDALYKANQAEIPADTNNNIGAQLVGKLDFTRIGLMGHSRGGDAVTSFLNYNRERPAPGRRYTGIRGVIALAPVDYERKAPYGTAFMTMIGNCDGDVSNLAGTRFFERSQYIDPDDPYPRIQAMLQGANHNWFNSTWFVDGDDATTSDAACSTSGTNANNIRLSGGTYTRSGNTGTFGSGDPALMGDQEKAGLGVMSSFFRRYVGSELAFDPYMTGEVQQDGLPALPATACPSLSAAGTRIPCANRLQLSYFAPPAERRDVIRPEPDQPTEISALGTSLSASGFANPYVTGGGVTPVPATTPSGLDWCNPEPIHFTPSAVGVSGNPLATKPCPLPGAAAVGGQNGTRENAPVNHSYGLQFALAWDNPLTSGGAPAKLSTRIPSTAGDVSGFRSLGLGAAVNFFDTRNPARGTQGLWDPNFTTQDFTIALTDSAGHEGTVSAADARYGNALHPTLGAITARVHVVLNEVRVPLTDFSSQGVDLTKVRKIELRFGELGKPATGSIELADVRFQEAISGPSPEAASFAAEQAAAAIEDTPRVSKAEAPDVILIDPPAPAVKATACTDVTAPVAKIVTRKAKGGKLTLTGTARDAACGTPGKVRTVEVTVYAKAGKACRFVTAKGTLSTPMSCASQVGLVAHGTTAWSLRLKRALKKGTYGVHVRAVDGAGNKQSAKPATLKIG